LIAAWVLVSIVITEFRLSADFEKDAFFFPWCRWWELLTGAFIAVSPPPIASKRVAAILGVFGFAAIAATFIFYDSSTRFPGL
jgi:peptidoglycan/LPS O-acetylase OafA/YrhL